ncbi:MAG: hypothetical protein ABIR47_16965 [Candidatus Kapaibacterium sp.]
METVIRRLGRFSYFEQIEAEMLRDGRDSDILGSLLASLVANGQLAKARYNNSNRCVAYGLPAWIVVSEGHNAWAFGHFDHEPIGKKVTGSTLKMEFYPKENHDTP